MPSGRGSRKENPSDWSPNPRRHVTEEGARRLLSANIKDAGVHELRLESAIVHEYVADAPDYTSRLVGFIGFRPDGEPVEEGVTVFSLDIGGSPNLLMQPVGAVALRHGVLHPGGIAPVLLQPNRARLLVEILGPIPTTPLRFELMLERIDLGMK